MSATLHAVRRILRDLGLLGAGAYPHSKILEDHCCESFQLVQFRYAIEDAFDMVITWEDFTRLKTIGELLSLIELHKTKEDK